MRSINLGRWSRYIERYFNIKGGGGLMDVDPSVRAILPFFNGVEDRYLQGWNRFGVAANVAAVAANFSRVRIRNPVGSNVITVLESLYLFLNNTADTPFVTWGATITDLTNLVSLTFTRMDPRGQPQPTSIVSQVAQAAGGQALLQTGTTPHEFIAHPDQEIPVLPGQVVDVQSNTANVQLGVSLIWRERAMETSELT